MAVDFRGFFEFCETVQNRCIEEHICFTFQSDIPWQLPAENNFKLVHDDVSGKHRYGN